MKSWQAALTLAGWILVFALLGMNLHAMAPVTFAVVAIWAFGTVALLKTPPFPSRGIAFAVSWVGSLLVIVWELVAWPSVRMQDWSRFAAIQTLLALLWSTWFCTYGMLPLFAVMTTVRPKMRCRVFEGTEHVPWRYWWAATLLITAVMSANVWYAWSLMDYAAKVTSHAGG
jgi:membrane-bound ClpP family serine protease